MTSGILGNSREPLEFSGMPRESPREFSGIIGSPMNSPGNHIGSASRASEVPTVALAAATDRSSSSQVMRVAMPSSFALHDERADGEASLAGVFLANPYTIFHVYQIEC